MSNSNLPRYIDRRWLEIIRNSISKDLCLVKWDKYIQFNSVHRNTQKGVPRAERMNICNKETLKNMFT